MTQGQQYAVRWTAEGTMTVMAHSRDAATEAAADELYHQLLATELATDFDIVGAEPAPHTGSED